VRVFVTGAGRCGTLTFAKACEAAVGELAGVAGPTVAHEGSLDKAAPWTYPDNHIEVDCRLVWHAHYLLEAYPDAYWIVLDRDRDAIAASWAKKGDLRAAFSMLAHAGGPRASADLYVGFVYQYLNRLFPLAASGNVAWHEGAVPYLWLTTPIGQEEAVLAWDEIGMGGSLGEFVRTLTRVYNRG